MLIEFLRRSCEVLVMVTDGKSERFSIGVKRSAGILPEISGV